MSFKNYLKEIAEQTLVQQMKDLLTQDGGYDSWEDAVDHQEIGDCQGIVNLLVTRFNQYGVHKVFGEIEIDEPYVDDDGEEQYMMTHHWITINDKPYDFAKGTLKNRINMDNADMYEPEVTDDSRYKEIM